MVKSFVEMLLKTVGNPHTTMSFDPSKCRAFPGWAKVVEQQISKVENNVNRYLIFVSISFESTDNREKMGTFKSMHKFFLLFISALAPVFFFAQSLPQDV